jgi:hypothetical protein
MKSTIQENRRWSTIHRISAEDNAAMAAMRAIVEPNRGRLQGTAARVPFDGIMERVVAPAGVTYEADTVGGVSGWWCRPTVPGPARGYCISMVVGLIGGRRRPSGISSAIWLLVLAWKQSCRTTGFPPSTPFQRLLKTCGQATLR